MGSSPGRGPWQWSDAYGDEGGDAVLRENAGNGIVLMEAACSVENIPKDVRRLIEQAPEMAAMLRELEWDNEGECPICGEWNVHLADCRLAKLLGELP